MSQTAVDLNQKEYDLSHYAIQALQCETVCESAVAYSNNDELWDMPMPMPVADQDNKIEKITSTLGFDKLVEFVRGTFNRYRLSVFRSGSLIDYAELNDHVNKWFGVAQESEREMAEEPINDKSYQYLNDPMDPSDYLRCVKSSLAFSERYAEMVRKQQKDLSDNIRKFLRAIEEAE